ncbi:Helix-turn-helix domain-containing protein [Agrobacterium fabrum]|uniref:helix-turn-helix domain-containing protein n=1 Tax=Agrobacterium fabrum TaxID=1176649 RepID=UPI0008894C42|nr:AraC family transcriptional regulator [Agrobacterium fabrum]SDB74244.1 Helix-turn-helix domain-containing protein [Agrobacterium fabrum]SES21974.1 Helix-turn-helix domain-containing protein [Agrobacterium fabrum]
MESENQYARRQVRQFKADSVAQIVAPGLGHSKLLVSRVERNTPEHGFATPAHPDAVFSVLVQLRQQERRELYLDDKLVHQGAFPKRTVSVVNHWQRPKANLLSAFDTVIFTVPQSALNAVAADHRRPPVETLVCEHEGRVDEAIWSLTQSLIPALERPEEIGALYAERVLLASTTYFAHTFGGMRPIERAPHRLSAKQTERVVDLMDSELQNDVSLSSLASQLDMMPGEFIRSFRRSSGTMPDVWFRDRRIERAKMLLRGKLIPDAKVAALCGFTSTDQFVRVFTAAVGVAPTTWRQTVLN